MIPFIAVLILILVLEIAIQLFLSAKKNKWLGVILPAINFSLSAFCFGYFLIKRLTLDMWFDYIPLFAFLTSLISAVFGLILLVVYLIKRKGF